MEIIWHHKSEHDVIASLKTDRAIGLTEKESALRLERYGQNILAGIQKKSWQQVLFSQFTNFLIVILIVAAIFSAFLGDIAETIAILLIVFLNGLLGFIQEWKAENALAALKQMLSPKCHVIREGAWREIDASLLVPGDIVPLETGNRIPADLRLIEAINFKADEAPLTGESLSVDKDILPLPEQTPLAERSCLAFMGTSVTNGRGKGVVIATGMATEFGRIAHLTEGIQSQKTPLQKKLAHLALQLGYAGIGISLFIIAIGIYLKQEIGHMILQGLSLAVAIVPEGLPAVVTITLALGVRAMIRRKALLRTLSAAEALGAASVICTDKTGTLTCNEMTVQKVWTLKGVRDINGVGYEPRGEIIFENKKLSPLDDPELQSLIQTGIICNHASIHKGEKGWTAIGEPTEAALITLSAKAESSISANISVISEFSFNSQRKRMTVVAKEGDQILAHIKGAPEIIFERATKIQWEDQIRPITAQDLEVAQKAQKSFAQKGLRTLALARKTLPPDFESLSEDDIESDLALLGIVGIIDPPRPEVKDAINLARSAGIKIIVITGDSPDTAKAISEQIGLKSTQIISGHELDAMDDDALSHKLSHETIFARTTPSHKLRLVTLLQKSGHITAMTGDGINDAPALKKADIGIAMGIRGTDVAKGAADMILTDDNFASIVGAIEEGRRQYDNVQKFVRYLLSSNVGEVIAISLNIFLGGPLILIPVQILWMNLITDGVTAVALGLEPLEKNAMQRPPRVKDSSIIGKDGTLYIGVLGGYIGLATLWVFYHYQANAVIAQTMAFTTVVIMEKFNVFNFKTLSGSLFNRDFFANRTLILAWVSMILLQVASIYASPLQKLLQTVPLGVMDWGIVLLLALPVVVIGEIFKYLLRTSKNA